ncbi:MAG: enoyl-CoA hydratase-related protein [Bacteroidota bacterium]
MSITRITYEASGRIASVTLNRPEKRNALDDVMVAELSSAFTQAGRDRNVKVVLLKGAGPAFSAGADLDYLRRSAGFDMQRNREDSGRFADLFRIMQQIRKPVVAAVHGPALAGGCGLASACDFVVAAEQGARFGYPEVRIGFVPALVLVLLVRRVGEGRARTLVLRGESIDAREAHRIGLADIVVPDADLERETAALVRDLLEKNSAGSMGLCKEMLIRLQGMTPDESLDFAASMNAAARMTPDCKKGTEGFLRKENVAW